MSQFSDCARDDKTCADCRSSGGHPTQKHILPHLSPSTPYPHELQHTISKLYHTITIPTTDSCTNQPTHCSIYLLICQSISYNSHHLGWSCKVKKLSRGGHPANVLMHYRSEPFSYKKNIYGVGCCVFHPSSGETPLTCKGNRPGFGGKIGSDDKIHYNEKAVVQIWCAIRWCAMSSSRY